MDCSLPGSSVHGILQARILEWVAISSSRGSSHPGDWTHISCASCIAGRFFTHWATWEALFLGIFHRPASSTFPFQTGSKNKGLPWWAQRVKNLPAMQETRVQSLGWEDPLEDNGYPLQYSCLENPMDRGLQSVRSQTVRHDWATNTFQG